MFFNIAIGMMLYVWYRRILSIVETAKTILYGKASMAGTGSSSAFSNNL
jgi:hypothetical protein